MSASTIGGERRSAAAEVRPAARVRYLCFSLQLIQERVHGIAFSRASAIGSPQSLHTPYDALLDTPQRSFDRLEDLGVGLFQLQLNVDFVVPAA